MRPQSPTRDACSPRESDRKKNAVWVLQWLERDGQDMVRRKQITGTVADLPTKAAALKACEFLRSTWIFGSFRSGATILCLMF